jgi:hypothetical protein
VAPVIATASAVASARRSVSGTRAAGLVSRRASGVSPAPARPAARDVRRSAGMSRRSRPARRQTSASEAGSWRVSGTTRGEWGRRPGAGGRGSWRRRSPGPPRGTGRRGGGTHPPRAPWRSPPSRERGRPGGRPARGPGGSRPGGTSTGTCRGAPATPRAGLLGGIRVGVASGARADAGRERARACSDPGTIAPASRSNTPTQFRILHLTCTGLCLPSLRPSFSKLGVRWRSTEPRPSPGSGDAPASGELPQPLLEALIHGLSRAA